MSEQPTSPPSKQEFEYELSQLIKEYSDELSAEEIVDVMDWHGRRVAWTQADNREVIDER